MKYEVNAVVRDETGPKISSNPATIIEIVVCAYILLIFLEVYPSIISIDDHNCQRIVYCHHSV